MEARRASSSVVALKRQFWSKSKKLVFVSCSQDIFYTVKLTQKYVKPHCNPDVNEYVVCLTSTLNSTSPHTIRHLERQHLTVSWSDGKSRLDTCVPDVCSYTCTLLFCLHYLPQATAPLWLNWESHQKALCLKQFFSFTLLSCHSHVFSFPSNPIFTQELLFQIHKSFLFSFLTNWELGTNCGI